MNVLEGDLKTNDGKFLRGYFVSYVDFKLLENNRDDKIKELEEEKELQFLLMQGKINYLHRLINSLVESQLTKINLMKLDWIIKKLK